MFIQHTTISVSLLCRMFRGLLCFIHLSFLLLSLLHIATSDRSSSSPATATRERERERAVYSFVESGRWLGSSLDLRSQVQRAPDLRSVEMVVPCFDDSRPEDGSPGWGSGSGSGLVSISVSRKQCAVSGFGFLVSMIRDPRTVPGFGFGFPFRFSFQEPTGGSRIWPIAAPGSCSSLIRPRTVHPYPGSWVACIYPYVYMCIYIYIWRILSTSSIL